MRIPSGRRSLHALLVLTFWTIAWPAQAGSRPNSATGTERVFVKSSSLVSIAFAREARVLEIEFRSGAAYRYLEVPPAVFEELKKADSKGRYFSQFIRGRYEFQRLKGPAR